MRGQPIKVRRALLSVWDKSDVVDLARELAALGIAIVSSGGTARVLRDADVAVTEVESVTGAPEILGGRVKTLHPNIHGGILAVRDDPDHVADLAQLGIEPIDLVVTNLYPFSSVAADAGSTEADVVEMIDIGGPAMVRAAAKNYSDVCVVTAPEEYPALIAELLENDGCIGYDMRRAAASRAFALTASYDADVGTWMTRNDDLPESIAFALTQEQPLRYGENPHQYGGLYLDGSGDSWLDGMTQHNGKELSFNNIWDTEAAWRLVAEFAESACVIIKHAMPCGVAEAPRLVDVFDRALACDDVSAFGGVVALNRRVDVATAQAMSKVFLEVVIAPEFDSDALDVLTAKKNLRLLSAPNLWRPSGFDMKRLAGGFIVQDWDVVSVDSWRIAGSREPSIEQWTDLKFVWRVTAHVRSNTIVMARDRQAVGIGSGQQSRIDAAEIAGRKADGRAVGGVAGSDAFFPFPDGIEACAAAGVEAIIAPSGSIRDDEVAAAADDLGVALVFAGERHFRH